MKKFFFVLVLNLVSLLFFFNSNISFAKPGWIEKVPEGYVYNYFVGIGESDELIVKAKKLAVSSAITELVQNGTIQISSKFTSTKDSTASEDGQKFIARVTEDVTINGSTKEIKGFSIVENFSESTIRNGKSIIVFYVLVRLPKKKS